MLTDILTKFLRPYRRTVSLILILLLIQSIASLYLPRLNADIINNGVAKGDIGYIWRIGGWMLGASILVMAASIWLAYLSSAVSMAFGRDLRLKIFTTVGAFSARELNDFGAPSLITRNTNDVQQVQMLVFMGLTMMVAAPITGIGAAIMAVQTNAKLSLLIVVIVPLMALVILLLLRRIVPLFRTVQIQIDRINLILREQIAGIRVIRAFVQRASQEEKFAGASDDLRATNLKVMRSFSLMFPIMTVILNLSTIAVLWFGGKLIDAGSMPIGNLTAFLSYIMQILMSVLMAVMMSMMIPRAAASAERINEVLVTKTSVHDPLSPVKVEKKPGIIEFKDVEFKAPGAEHPILSGLNFSIHPGQFTAIVGSTGSGKSTVLNLIPRFIDVTHGSILIDGQNIRERSLEDLWSEIGMVPQRSLMFRGTIASNLRFGKAEASEEELWHALVIAQARDFVEALPEKLNAPVAQGGTNFSGGQRQRLAIARALVKNPQIYLLDDSFSALDFTTDSKLREALHREVGSATLVVVAQRVSSILHADQIIVFDAGVVVGIGQHHELMESCSIYKEIVLSQLSPEEAA